MQIKDLETGKHVLKRTGNSDPRVPLYTGQIRLEDGTTLNAAGWERTAKETGEVYIGGYVTPVDQNPDPLHRPADGEDKTSFALFANDKQGNEKRPDMRGNVGNFQRAPNTSCRAGPPPRQPATT